MEEVSNIVQNGDSVSLLFKDGTYDIVEAKPKKMLRAGKARVPLQDLIGLQYGTFWDISNGKWRSISLKDFSNISEDINVTEDGLVCGDNRNFTDSNTAQSLTAEEIEKMRNEGTTGKDIIGKLVEKSETFQQKSDYAKAKYIKRKQKKYEVFVCILRPTTRTIGEHLMANKPEKILFLRTDSLGLMLSLGNIRPGISIGLVDETSAFLTGAVLSRVQHYSKVVVCDVGKKRTEGVLQQFNFRSEHCENLFRLNSNLLRNPSSAEDLEKKIEDLQSHLQDPQKQNGPLAIAKKTLSALQHLTHEKLDTLLCAVKGDPLYPFFLLLPYLKYGAPFVVYSVAKEPLVVLFRVLQTSQKGAQLQIQELFSRQYQVLDNRTHPKMSMHGHSGFVLSGLYVEGTSTEVSTTLSSTNEKRSLEESPQELDDIRPAKIQKTT
eukprot:GCRY01003231.1.p1 GENE.GCRY01003231.1~~GCRY01003231.1.p1  ORF type:complete len:435 (-),score=43.90 GCRY01003231.1:111-1415(-)